ncbi:hypothetical protein D1007_03188 [Hordeum vulgare]|nr:hypothetical protein D1007_03188 [Hordeum vulgare]
MEFSGIKTDRVAHLGRWIRARHLAPPHSSSLRAAAGLLVEEAASSLHVVQQLTAPSQISMGWQVAPGRHTGKHGHHGYHEGGHVVPLLPCLRTWHSSPTLAEPCPTGVEVGFMEIDGATASTSSPTTINEQK